MTATFSPSVIEALVQVISGGDGMASPRQSIGLYRTKSDIEGFLMDSGIDPSQGAGSRLPALRECLRWAVQQPEGDDLIRRAIENVADPRTFDAPDTADDVLKYLNQRLAPDGFEVQILGGKAVLHTRGSASAAVNAVAEHSKVLDFDTVSRGIDRALANVEDDPEDAVTAACAMIESVCRSILIELKLPLPDKKDVSALYKAVQEPLRLSPARTNLPKETADDVRQILGGLITVTKGVGALRTHSGDAHGREKGAPIIDARIARLSIHSASTISLFLIETWQREQRRTLPNRSADDE